MNADFVGVYEKFGFNMLSINIDWAKKLSWNLVNVDMCHAKHVAQHLY